MKLNSKKIRALSSENLNLQLEASLKELLRLNLRRRLGPIEKNHQFSSLRREIARIRTIQRERSLEKQDL
jgi:ribosomal protein L29